MRRLTGEEKIEIDTAAKQYLEQRIAATLAQRNGGPAIELEAAARKSFTALTAILWEVYGPQSRVGGTPECEAYNRKLRQVEKRLLLGLLEAVTRQRGKEV